MTFPTRYELLDSSGVDWGGKEKENKTWQQKIFDTHDHVTVDQGHMKGQKTACFSVQSYSTLSETILLFLRPLSSSSWSNPQLVRFPRPTPRRWLLKSGREPVQLSTNNWTPSFPPLRSFDSAATSELHHHERRDVFLLSKNKHATELQNLREKARKIDKEKERIYIYK